MPASVFGTSRLSCLEGFLLLSLALAGLVVVVLGLLVNYLVGKDKVLYCWVSTYECG